MDWTLLEYSRTLWVDENDEVTGGYVSIVLGQDLDDEGRPFVSRGFGFYCDEDERFYDDDDEAVKAAAVELALVVLDNEQ